MSHVVRSCPVCGQRFVGGRSARTCSRSCDDRETCAAASVVPDPTPTPASSRPRWTPPATNRRSPVAVQLSELREALRASVRRQLEEGRRMAAS